MPFAYGIFMFTASALIFINVPKSKRLLANANSTSVAKPVQSKASIIEGNGMYLVISMHASKSDIIFEEMINLLTTEFSCKQLSLYSMDSNFPSQNSDSIHLIICHLSNPNDYLFAERSVDSLCSKFITQKELSSYNVVSYLENLRAEYKHDVTTVTHKTMKCKTLIITGFEFSNEYEKRIKMEWRKAVKMLNSFQWASLCNTAATSSGTSNSINNKNTDSLQLPLLPAYSWLNISAWESIELWQQTCRELIPNSNHSDTQFEKTETENNDYNVNGKKKVYIFNFVKSFT